MGYTYYLISKSLWIKNLGWDAYRMKQMKEKVEYVYAFVWFYVTIKVLSGNVCWINSPQ